MKINQIMNSIHQTFKKQKAQKQDLTSFKSANNAELMSKQSVQALKNKYAAQPSFSGEFKTLKIDSTDQGDYTDKYRGTDGKISDYPSHDCAQIRNWKRKPNVTTTLGGEKPVTKVNEELKSLGTIAIEAIENSDSFIEGSTVKRGWVGTPKPNYTKINDVKVYFSDPNEEVPFGDMVSSNYVVYAPGAYNEDV